VIEGWYGGDYLVLFQEDAPAIEKAYDLSSHLPNHRLVGLRSWDDFIVEDEDGNRFTLPTVPLSLQYLRAYPLGDVRQDLVADEGLRGKIKWYIKPVVFGGDPGLGENIAWVALDQHAQLVRFWNRKYQEIRHES